MIKKKGNLVMINNSLYLPNRVELLMLRTELPKALIGLNAPFRGIQIKLTRIKVI